MQHRTPFFLSAVVVACVGCGPAYDRAEVDRVVFKDSGVLGGYDFGVTWEHIKANHDEVFEVRDDDFKQLRRETMLHNAGANGYFLGFDFDKDGGAHTFSVSINGSNTETLSQVLSIYTKLQSKYDGEYGPGDCTEETSGMSSTTCVWSGALYVKLSTHTLSTVDKGGMDLTIAMPAE